MKKGINPLVMMIQRIINPRLAAEHDFLRAENRVLRELIADKARRRVEQHQRRCGRK